MKSLLLALLVACSSSSSPPVSHKPSDTGAVTEEQFKAMHAPPTAGPAKVDGQTFDLNGTKAYLSLPKGPGPFPAIVVIHEWWGLNANIEHWADRLASAGWAAIAIDLYGGVVATKPDEAMAAMKAVDETKAKATLDAAIEFAKSDPRIKATKRAVIGWCFGGGWSLQTALAHPELDGAIMYYGELETDPAKLGAIHGKLLGVFGDQDKGIPPADVQKFDAALTAAHVDHEIHHYDAPHAFANPSNPHYDEKSAADAWTHVLAFLDKIRS
jgi:carboxymethylenebutenolidase